MSLLSGYLMRTIILSTLLVLMVLLSLGALFEFIGQLEDVKGTYGIPEAMSYTLLRLPQLSFEMLPIAVLIGSLMGLGGLISVIGGLMFLIVTYKAMRGGRESNAE